MKPFYKKLSLFSIFIIFGSFIGYYYIIPFIINNILVPIHAYQSYSVYKEYQKEKSIDEDYSYFDELGNKIVILDFKKNTNNIEKTFFEKNISGKLFHESIDLINDKFEFKIVEFNKIDSLKYKLRVRKDKIQEEKEIDLNNRKFSNYLLELEKIENELKIKKCDLIKIELD